MNICKSKIELGLPFIVTDLVYIFQMTCFGGTQIIERKPNAGNTERHY